VREFDLVPARDAASQSPAAKRIASKFVPTVAAAGERTTDLVDSQ
jgi:hypothetical protein